MNNTSENFLRKMRVALAVAADFERAAANMAGEDRADALEYADACGAIAANKLAAAIRLANVVTL